MHAVVSVFHQHLHGIEKAYLGVGLGLGYMDGIQ
jgi:hypothetical protein